MYIENNGIVALILYTVSCGAPKADETVHYLINNSMTLEGSNVTYRCSTSTDVQLNTFTSICYKNASWVPDPISHCAALQSGKLICIMMTIINEMLANSIRDQGTIYTAECHFL